MTENNENSRFKWVEKVFVPVVLALLGGGLAAVLALLTWACSEGFICEIKLPDASFTGPNKDVVFPMPVAVNNTSTGDIEKYNWDFGDGRGVEEKSPKAIYYFEPGEYTITLTVEGKHGKDSFSVTIQIISDSGDDSEVIVPPEIPVQPEVSAVAVSPGNAFSNYFKLIEQQSYNTTWTLLTENWKARYNAAGFTAYQEWVENIASVKIDNSEVICQTDSYAVILADITYLTKSSNQPYIQQNRYFRLRAANDTWLFDDAGENPRTCSANAVSLLPTTAVISTAIPSIAPVMPDQNAITFCLDEPSQASGYACVNPVTRLPGGISRFYYSRSFKNIAIGTQIRSRWYHNGVFIPILERTITYEGRWVTTSGIQYSWVQEVPGQFELTDGLYSVEVFIDADNIADQTGMVQIGN